MASEELLARTTLANDLQPDQLQALAAYAEVRQVAAGEAVLTRHDAEYPLIVLLEGAAEVRGLFDQRVSSLKPGALVGEIAFFDHGARSADVVATEASRVAVFPPDLLGSLKRERPDVAALILENISLVLCSKLRWAQRMIDANEATNPWPDR